jgi:5,10-methenyltetrahydrofolate synthetase
MDDLGSQKRSLRLRHRGRETSRECSLRLCALLEEEYARRDSGGLFLGVSSLAAYYPLKGEADILPFLARWTQDGRSLLLPCFHKLSGQYSLAAIPSLDGQWLVRGKCGIPEPREEIERILPPFLEMPQLWLVPGLAFDKQGVRLGHGCGWYDRLMQGSPFPKIGVCPAERLEDRLPAEEHDVRMDFLLSENGILPIPS